MLGGADNPNGELPSYITGADNFNYQDETHVQQPEKEFISTEKPCLKVKRIKREGC